MIINPSGAWSFEGDVGTPDRHDRLFESIRNDIGAIAAVLAVGCYVRAVERASLKYAAAAVSFIVRLLSVAFPGQLHSAGNRIRRSRG